MPLPGKLCIGILEEDNPLKSFFRFKPILVESDGQFAPFSEYEDFPEDGCIRIVPDKNESYHFKVRMRRIGLFCVVNLRGHPESNDKIRPNKNYHEGGSERNAHIIYSDVVREPLEDLLYEIVPADRLSGEGPAPRTAAVLVRGEEGLLPQRFEWEAVDGDPTLARIVDTGRAVALEALQVFELPGLNGETLNFAIAPPPAREAMPVREAMPARESAPSPTREAAASLARESALSAERAALRVAAPAPSEDEKRPTPPEKPWLHHDSSMTPPPVDPRLSPAQRILAAQSGLNPRRGRSLQELIDEKWAQSRLNQLGHAVADLPTGEPLLSPVDGAVRAVREAWNQPNLRGELLSSLSAMDEFGASLQECREAVRRSDIEQHLNDLEARRLELLGEIDRLKAGGDAIRRQLMQDIRREEADALADAVQKTEAARAEQQHFEALAQEARAAATDARRAVDALSTEALEEHLRDFALNQHMLERMALIRGEGESAPAEKIHASEAEPEALVQRVLRRFEAAGRPLSRLEAANLTACALISPMLFLSGPVGCGKTRAARLLSEALGWTAAGRYAEFAPGRASLEADPRVTALAAEPDAPALLVLDDANLYPLPDPLRALGSIDLRREWRLCLTLQDTHSGHPLPAAALDRGFMVRLNAGDDAPWQPPRRASMVEEAPASLGALAAKLLPVASGDVPAACDQLMAQLRASLKEVGASVSRRALDDAWNYCGVMHALMGDEAAPEVLLDLAFAQRILPALLADAPAKALVRMPALLSRLPRSRALLDQPLPVML